jgi:hypothetical protein
MGMLPDKRSEVNLQRRSRGPEVVPAGGIEPQSTTENA